MKTRRRGTHIVTVHIIRTLALSGDTPERFQTVGGRTDRAQFTPRPVESLGADARGAVGGAASSVHAIALIRVW